jgi:uncharacterized radical SAM superfamily Fe-S cluster-containing enzyme
LCPGHKQHLCTTLIEITDRCNLRCPVCYFGESGQTDIPLQEFKSRLATALRTENGTLDVLQISGGEPTLHSAFPEILAYAAAQNINRVLVNTNGLTLSSKPAVFDIIKAHRDKVEVYFQFDGFDGSTNARLRGRDLLQQKLEAIRLLDAADIKICLAVTVTPESLSQIGRIIEFASSTKNISGVTFQRFTKTGHGEHADQASLQHEDILQAIADTGHLKYKHIVPLPCSHENCTSISFLFIVDEKSYSLGDLIDYAKHQHIIRDKLGFDATTLDYIREQLSCGSGGCCSWITNSLPVVKKLREFTEGKASNYKNMKILRIVVKNFMDAHTFDAERAQKCCVGVSIGRDRIVPFCVNNIFNKRRTADAC